MVPIIIAIPARLASTRFPQKLLQPLGNKNIIQHVVDRALALAEKFNALVMVATDDQKIADTLKIYNNIHVELTDPDLKSGTDRIYRALQQRAQHHTVAADAVILNIQGDEPFFSQKAAGDLIQAMLCRPQIKMGTLVCKKKNVDDFFKTSTVKVIINHLGFACYFSRAPIPWPRPLLGASQPVSQAIAQRSATLVTVPDYFQHIGLYAFRYAALAEFTALTEHHLEETEGLEQLRAIEHGWNILTVTTPYTTIGIDTPEDLLLAQDFLIQQQDS